jgi:hypothetical protein
VACREDLGATGHPAPAPPPAGDLWRRLAGPDSYALTTLWATWARWARSVWESRARLRASRSTAPATGAVLAMTVPYNGSYMGMGLPDSRSGRPLPSGDA